MHRFSIRALMAFIVVSAVGLAALRNANEFWAGIMLLASLAAFGSAVLGAIFSRGLDQAWWTGFAFFSAGYLALAVGPWFVNTIQPILCTTYVLRAVHPHIMPLTSEDALDLHQWRAQRDQLELRLREAESLARSGSDPGLIAAKRAVVRVYQQVEAIHDAANDEQFQQIGHSLFALVAGWAGGTIAAWFYARQKGADATAA